MKTLKSIKFPVYPIPNNGKIVSDDGRLVYEIKSGTQFIIDDTRLNGSFVQRRLAIKDKLLPLKKSIPSLGNLILFSSIYRRFIDSNGKLFKYKKSFFVPLIIREITRNVPYKNGAVLFAENIHCPFMFYRQLNYDEKYVILAVVGNGYILIGLSARNYLRKKKIKL